MSQQSMTLSIRPERFSICRLGTDVPIRDTLKACSFWSVTRTGDEISVVLPESDAPADWEARSGWRCLKVKGPLAFDQVGVLASLTAPLADAAISVFAISTFDTDYLLVRDSDLVKAQQSLTDAGHTIKSMPETNR